MSKVIRLSITGMTCANCELTIEQGLSKVNGIEKISASYKKEEVILTYHPNLISLEEITGEIQRLDYDVRTQDDKKSLGDILPLIIILIGGYIILNHLGVFRIMNVFPQVTSSTGYGMLFVIGILTSFHCIAMCGGVNLAQSVNSVNKGEGIVRPNIMYNLGRLTSYTLVGGIVGMLGSVISPGGRMKGAVAIFAGAFMVIMGINMLNLFPFLRTFNIRMPKFIARWVSKKKATSHSSFIIGLLNGFMPCGPLQGMQLYALSTKSFLLGGISMFLFCLGTIPLMFGFGIFSSKMNKKFTRNIMYVCGMLIVFLGIGMFRNGMTLSGFSMPIIKNSEIEVTAHMDGDYQTVVTEIDYNSYKPIVLKSGVPVKWTIIAEKGKLNGCNNELYVPEYDINIKLKEGENVIEFLPEKEGTYSYSCWMGMIKSYVHVKR